MANLLDSIINYLSKAIVYREGTGGEPNRLYLNHTDNPVGTVVFSNNGGIRLTDNENVDFPSHWIGTTNNVYTGDNSYPHYVRGSSITLSKEPIIGTHTTAIGSSITYTGNSTTSAGTTAASLGSVNVPAGTWLIMAYVTFSGNSNADGFRRAAISSTQNTISTQAFGVDGRFVTGNVIAVCSPYLVVTTTATSTTFYLNASASGTTNISKRSMYALRLL